MRVERRRYHLAPSFGWIQSKQWKAERESLPACPEALGRIEPPLASHGVSLRAVAEEYCVSTAHVLAYGASRSEEAKVSGDARECVER